MIKKKQNQTPKIYALILKSKGNAILHLGIHYTLDDAILAATPTLANMADISMEDNVSVEMHASLEGNDVLYALSQEAQDFPNKGKKQELLTPKENMEEIKRLKNQLISSVIKTKDIDFLEKNKSMFTKAEQKYIQSQVFYKVTKNI